MILSNMLRILISITCLLIVSFTNGQAYYEHLTIEDGLSSNCVRSIFRDSKNRMWIGTENGIGIWENGNFVQINQPLIGNNIWHITEDHRNRIWFSNYGRGVSCWDNGKITYLDKKKGLKYSTVRKIKSFKKNIYFGAENGLSVLLENGKLIHWGLSKKTDNYSHIPFQVMDFIVIKNEIYIATRDGILKKVVLRNSKIEIVPLIKTPQTVITGAYLDNEYLYLFNEFTRRIKLTDYISEKHSKTDTISEGLIWQFTKLNNRIYGASWGVNTNIFGLYEFTGGKPKAIIKDEHFGWTVEHNKNELWYGTLDNGIYILKPQEKSLRIKNDFPWGSEAKLIDHCKHDQTTAYLTKEGVTFLQNGLIKKIQHNVFQKEYIRLFKSYQLPYKIPININDPYAFQYTRIKYMNNKWFVLSRVGLFCINPQTFKLEYALVNFPNTFAEYIDGEYILCYEYNGIKKCDSQLRIRSFSEVKIANGKFTPTVIVYMTKIGNCVYLIDNNKGLWKYQNKVLSPVPTNIFPDGINPLFGATLDNGTIGVVTNDNKITLLDPSSGKSVKSIFAKELGVRYIQGMTSFQNWVILATESEIIAWNGILIKRTNRFQKPFQATLTNFKCSDGMLTFLRGNEWINWDIRQWLTMINNAIIDYQMFRCEIGGDKIPFSIHETVLNGGERIIRSYDQNSLVLKLRLWNQYKQNGFELFYRFKKGASWTSLNNNGVLELLNLAPDNYQVQFKIIAKEANNTVITPVIYLQIQYPWYQTWWFIAFLFVMLSVLFTVLLRVYYRKKAKKTKEAFELEQKLSELKMEALQAQMNPHFIFNAMNAIQHFIIDQETDKAMYFLGEFSRLIRNVLDYTRIKTITIDEEFDFLRRYISIENMRFEGKIKLHAPYLNSIAEVLIPPLILQPLIENAILHGSETDGEIRIDIRIDNQSTGVLLEIRNAREIKLKKSGHQSRGKEIIEERLKHFHPEAHISFFQAENEYHAKLWIPTLFGIRN